MSMRGRGRSRGGGSSGPSGGTGGLSASGDTSRRGSWRNGPPPGSGGYSGRGGMAGSTGHEHRPSFGEHSGDRSKTFQTDTDISASARAGERELQRWQPDINPVTNGGSTPSPGTGARPGSGASGRNNETFGDLSSPLTGGNASPAFGANSGGGGKSVVWDQFEANERLFGAKTDYEEEFYTTKLNRSGADFKKREKEAERLANEIMSKTSSNPHIAEERGQVVPNDVLDEETKYSGVIRSANAYVPPGARRAAGQGAIPTRQSGSPGPSSTATAAGSTTNGTSDTHSTPAIRETTTETAAASVDPAIMSISQSSGPAASIPNSSAGASTGSAVNARRPSDVTANTTNGVSSDDKNASLTPIITTTSTPGPVSESGTTNLKNIPLPSLSVQPPLPGPKDVKVGGVVDEARQFMQSEREKVEAKKQSMAKMERLRTIAQFKDFQQSFKVPLPIPEDILPILTKDEEKQKAIVAKVNSPTPGKTTGSTPNANKSISSLLSSPDPAGTTGGRLSSSSHTSTSPTSHASRRIPKMKIPEIPPFKRKVPAPAIPVPETATQNIPLATSPTPSAGSLTSGAGASVTGASAAAAAKLNPNANAFVFKPNPSATSFKPAGQASIGGIGAGDQNSSPTALTSKPIGPSTGGPSSSPGATTATSPAGPSSAYKNPFFTSGPPKRISANPRDDFNPWKHGPVPLASAVAPQWPYTGRKSSMSFAGGIPPIHGMGMVPIQLSQPPLGMYDEDGSGAPHLVGVGSGGGLGVGMGGVGLGPGGVGGLGVGGPPMPPQMMPAGMTPNFAPYYRYQPGIPPPPMGAGLGGMLPNNNLMFNPGPGGYGGGSGGGFQGAPVMQSPPPHLAGVGMSGPGGGGPPHQPNSGVGLPPMYFANGIPPGATHFIQNQIHFGGGQGGNVPSGRPPQAGLGPQGMNHLGSGGPGMVNGGPGGPMFYGNMPPSTHPTPQMQPARPFSAHPTPQPQFSQLPIPAQPTGTFESASPH